MASNTGDLTGYTLGTCTLISLLGQGGMGTVYLAQQARPSRNVAVKVLLPQLVTQNNTYQEFQLRFQREADLIAKLEHVNIMPIYEYGEQDELAYLVMPYLTGGSLRDILSKRGALSMAETITYIEQAGSALDYAHAQGVIHRDLKPANFLLHGDGRLVLADFGIARMMEQSNTSAATLTGTGIVLGTPDYMAPEMASGAPIDYRADIYELGVVLFQMLSGHVPFTGSTPFTIALRHMQEPLPLLHQFIPAIPSAVDAVIQKATAKRPEDRYQSARVMAQALRYAGTVPEAVSGSMGYVSAPLGQSGPIVLAGPTEQAYMAQQRATTAQRRGTQTALASANYAQAYAQASQAHMQQRVPVRKRSPWGLVIGLLVTLLVIAGGTYAALEFFGNNQGGALGTNSVPTAQPSGSTLSPLVALPTGIPIYTATNPGCEKKRVGWTSFKASFSCENGQTLFTSEAGHIGGLFLTRIIGRDYVISPTYAAKARLQLTNAVPDGIGLYFRSTQQGGYIFLMHPDGNWQAYAYNGSGTLSTLTAGKDAISDVAAPVNLAVATSGSQFSFYANNKLLGNATDQTYSTGSIGIAGGSGVTATISGFMLYGH